MVRIHDNMPFWFMVMLQPTASGTHGARGAAALSPATADGRGECGCVRGQRWRGSSATAAERKSESAATSAVQVSQDNKAFPLDGLFGVDAMSHYVWSGRTNARGHLYLPVWVWVREILTNLGNNPFWSGLLPICDAEKTLRISVFKRGFMSLLFCNSIMIQTKTRRL